MSTWVVKTKPPCVQQQSPKHRLQKFLKNVKHSSIWNLEAYLGKVVLKQQATKTVDPTFIQIRIS